MDSEQFAAHPKVKTRLNVLPENPDTADPKKSVGLGRFPKWLHRKLPKGNHLWETHDILKTGRLPTVCEEAKCPNLLECFSKKTATFLALGKECTRACGFCDIDFSKNPKPLEADEPARLAQSVKELGLKHVVITQVARDDLIDGGAAQMACIIEEVRRLNPTVTIEVLTSDFQGDEKNLDLIIQANPEIFNHNIETVESLTHRVRHKATYRRTLNVLAYIKQKAPQIKIKSGIMVGLGETDEMVEQTLRDLFEIGCEIVTIGQYLQPNRHKLRVKRFVTPETFAQYTTFGHSIGLKHVYSGPFVRSSYNAADVFREATK